MKQYGFYMDSSKCSGCKTCQVTCKDRMNLALGVKWRRVYEYGGGNWLKDGDIWHHDVFGYYLSISCNHCAQPACTKACPTGAMAKNPENGLVIVDQDLCIGCRYCEMACPYNAPQFDPEKKVMSKCDGCIDRLQSGRKPACVESCLNRALDFAPIDELRQKYGVEASIAPLPPSSQTEPSLVIKPHPEARVSGSRDGSMKNPAEV